MIRENYLVNNIYIDKDTLFFNMENYQNVSSEVVGIYIFNNVNKSKNAVKDKKNIKKLKINLDLMCKYLKLNETFQFKSRIKLVDEEYYLPIIYKGENIFPIKYSIGNNIIIITKNKDNFIEIKKEKNNNEILEEHKFDLYSLEKECKSYKIEVKEYLNNFNLKMNKIWLINRKTKEKINLDFERIENRVIINIQDKFISNINNRSIWDLEYEYNLGETKVVKRIEIRDISFNNIYHNFNFNDELIEVKAYKTADNNLAFIFKTIEKNNVLNYKRKIYNTTSNIVSNNTNKVILEQVYFEENNIIIKVNNGKILQNKKIIFKGRRNSSTYNCRIIEKGEFSYIKVNLNNDMSILNGIYDLRDENGKGIGIENSNIIVNPIILIDDNIILRVRPYLTLDGNISFLLRNNNNYNFNIKKIVDSKKEVSIHGNLLIPYISKEKIKIKSIYIEDKEYKKNYAKLKTCGNKDNLYGIFSFKKNIFNDINLQKYYIKFTADIDGKEYSNYLIIKDGNNLVKDEILLGEMQTNPDSYKQYSILTDNTGKVFGKISTNFLVNIVNLKVRKKSYKIKLELQGISEQIINLIESIEVSTYNNKIIELNKKKLKKKNNIYHLSFVLKTKELLYLNNSSKLLLNIYIGGELLILPICTESEKLLKNRSTFKSGKTEYLNECMSIFLDRKFGDLNIECRKLKENEIKANIFKFELIRFICKIFKKFMKKDIWLVGEELGNIAQDNGFAFFKYCMNENIDKNVFYIAKKDNKNMNDLMEYGKNIVYYDSLKHKVLYCLSKYLIVSHGIRDVMPTILHNKMANNDKDIIYLQHGIIAMKKLFFNKDSYNGKIKKFIVSSDNEKNILIKQMNFNEDQVLISGLARFDNIKDISRENEKKKIIIMPTWREWLINSEDELKKSKFYNGYLELFRSERLNNIIKKYNVEINFVLHINMEKYSSLFGFINNENIKLIDLRHEKISNLIYSGDLWITDYSSVVLDFNYLKKPSLFFQPDKNEYLTKRGSFINFDTELVGDVSYTADELINNIEEYICNDFKYKEKFWDISKKYYKYNDTNNCNRIYKAIIELDGV